MLRFSPRLTVFCFSDCKHAEPRGRACKPATNNPTADRPLTFPNCIPACRLRLFLVTSSAREDLRRQKCTRSRATSSSPTSSRFDFCCCRVVDAVVLMIMKIVKIICFFYHRSTRSSSLRPSHWTHLAINTLISATHLLLALQGVHLVSVY